MNVIMGTMETETIPGTIEDDFILDLAGNDVVWGGEGADTFYNNRGDDRLFGQGGDDIFFFYSKTTKLDAERRIFINGGEGEDTIQFERDAQHFELVERRDKTILKFEDDLGTVRIVIHDVEQIELANATWDL